MAITFDNGTSIVTLDGPTDMGLQAEDRTVLQANRQGKVIAANNGGNLPRRRRKVGVRLTSAQLASLQTFIGQLTSGDQHFLFTDTNGRVWTAFWEGDFSTREDAYSSVGYFSASIGLLLSAVSSDAGTGAYSNADAGQMNMLKAGGAAFYWPLAYGAPLQRTDLWTAAKQLGANFLADDLARFTARTDRVLPFKELPDAFMTALEDYYTNTLNGAANPFTLAHFRDASATYRWIEGMAFAQNAGLRWDGSIKLRKEV